MYEVFVHQKYAYMCTLYLNRGNAILCMYMYMYPLHMCVRVCACSTWTHDLHIPNTAQSHTFNEIIVSLLFCACALFGDMGHMTSGTIPTYLGTE